MTHFRATVCARVHKYVATLVFLFLSALNPPWPMPVAATGSVGFTELMINPSGDDGFFRRGRSTEWLEIGNGGPDGINLLGWGVEKVSGTRILTLGTVATVAHLAPGAVAVLIPGEGIYGPNDFRHAWAIPEDVLVVPLSGWGNTSRFGLANSGGELRLLDASGDVVDRVAYGRVASVPPPPDGRALEFAAPLVSSLSELNDAPDGWIYASRPIPRPGIYSGVVFGADDYGSPGSHFRIAAVPAPPTLWLMITGLAVVSTAVRPWRRETYRLGLRRWPPAKNPDGPIEQSMAHAVT